MNIINMYRLLVGTGEFNLNLYSPLLPLVVEDTNEVFRAEPGTREVPLARFKM